MSPNLHEIHRIVAAIPPGNVTTYGEIAKVAGTGARYIGSFMRRHGSDLPWWRVLRADGQSHDFARAKPYWDAEGISYTRDRAILSKHGLDAADLRQVLRTSNDN